MKLSLVVSQGKPVGKEIVIRLPQFLIGRDPECHLRPASPLVSKRHCAILTRDSKVFLRDFDSTNGTTVNGQPLKGETELEDGDEFKVGPLNFRVKLEPAAVDQPTPVPTNAEAKAAATAGAKAAAPAAKNAPAKPVAVAAKGVDEDAIVEMLLNLEGDPGAAPLEAGEAIPPGSTIMEIPGIEVSEPDKDKEKEKETKPGTKRTEKKAIDPTSTANAAKAILDKYMRRPRP